MENEKRTDRNSWAELDENRLSDILTASQIKATDTYVTPPQIIWIDNSTIATLGNFSASTGKAKAKKTFNVSAIVAASLAGRQVLNYRAHLPEGKRIVIDSKVSLTAFVGYTSAESEEERRRHLAAHVASVRQHVAELGRKEYQRRLNSPDFVIMFVPNEPAFLAALQNDPAIWADAYDRKVIVSSPTNLFALLKLVADLWKYNDQDKNTKEIAACGLKLYEQLVAFTSSLEGVGTALDKARDAYEDAHKRLCTGNDNIVRVGERLRKTASLQTKKRHSARTLETAGADEDPAALSATESAAETAAKSAAEAAATDTTAQ